MGRKKTHVPDKKKKLDSVSVTILIILICLIGLSTYMICKTYNEGKEFDESPDKRTVLATVDNVSVDWEEKEDSDGERYRLSTIKYDLVFSVDNVQYSVSDLYTETTDAHQSAKHIIESGTTQKIHVYKDSKGLYQLVPDSNWVTYVIFSVIIGFCLIVMIGLFL